MKSHPELITNASDIQLLVQALEKESIIAFDTEFIRETTFYPIVEIIQVATSSESWLVDAQAFKKKYPIGPKGAYDPGLQPLLNVFQNQKILKIAHASQGDQECLYTSFGVTATPILDTSIAASLCGMGDSVGLGKLLLNVLDKNIPKGHARTDWSVRPLPSQLLNYAHSDVIYLVELGQKLMSDLDKLKRKEWALEVSAKASDYKLYDSDPDEITARLAKSGKLDQSGFSVLNGLIRWREERVRQVNLPRRWVADDNVLMDLAQVRPKTLDHLNAFRGLNKGEIKNSGEKIIEVIKKFENETTGVEVPEYKRPDSPNTDEGQVIDLLRCYIGILADQLKISSRYLLNASQLLKLIRAKPKTAEDMVKTGVLGGRVAELIGNDILAFLRGTQALSIKGNRIKIVSLDSKGE
jgi:ribonuclease D